MMDLKNLLEDDAGVSPVIGVILMVAITVILAAVIGTFVLNNNNLNNTAPSANWDYSYDANGNGKVVVTHEGGDDVEASNIQYSGDAMATSPVDTGFSGTISAGSSDTIDSNSGTSPKLVSSPSGKTVRIVWTSPEGGSSSTIGEYEIP